MSRGLGHVLDRLALAMVNAADRARRAQGGTLPKQPRTDTVATRLSAPDYYDPEEWETGHRGRPGYRDSTARPDVSGVFMEGPPS